MKNSSFSETDPAVRSDTAPSGPVFSIITANFNSGGKLRKTATSVLSQDATLEYIIVNGASTDDSLAIARALASERPGTVRLISEPDRGIYDAMNKGPAPPAGDTFFFLARAISSLMMPCLTSNDVCRRITGPSYMGTP